MKKSGITVFVNAVKQPVMTSYCDGKQLSSQHLHGIGGIPVICFKKKATAGKCVVYSSANGIGILQIMTKLLFEFSAVVKQTSQIRRMAQSDSGELLLSIFCGISAMGGSGLPDKITIAICFDMSIMYHA